jgi:cyclic pyranopterin phosphate synthase
VKDSNGREIGYLRLSLTSACAMRCTYCRPAVLAEHGGAANLTPDEIESLVRHLVARHGLRKVRLTGGDPTARPDLIEIIRRLAAIDGLGDLAMTTNGLTLVRHARDYAEAGLHRVNVSLDTLDARKFARITGVDAMARVIAGIDEALAVGLSPLKLNTVVLRGENEADLPGLLAFAASRGVAIRFIELMPMGPLAAQWADRYVPMAQMRRTLDPHIVAWRALPQATDSATRFDVTLRDGRRACVGFITPMSCNFCAACNRIRIAGDGTLYPCLMDKPGPTLLPALRPTFNPHMLDQTLLDALAEKKPEHPAHGHTVMVRIGG